MVPDVSSQGHRPQRRNPKALLPLSLFLGAASLEKAGPESLAQATGGEKAVPSPLQRFTTELLSSGLAICLQRNQGYYRSVRNVTLTLY